jgi:hypothetical protein
MFPRNKSFPKHIACALLALCLLAGGCSTQSQVVLTRQQVAGFLEGWDSAQQNEDMAAVIFHLSPKLQYKLTIKGFGETETLTGNYQQYLASTKRGFEVGKLNSRERAATMIGVHPGGQSASAVFDLYENVTIEGEVFRTVTAVIMTIEQEDGRPVITSLEYVTSPDTGNRQPLQSGRN